MSPERDWLIPFRLRGHNYSCPSPVGRGAAFPVLWPFAYTHRGCIISASPLGQGLYPHALALPTFDKDCMLYTLALPLYDRYCMVQAPGLPSCDIVG